MKGKLRIISLKPFISFFPSLPLLSLSNSQASFCVGMDYTCELPRPLSISKVYQAQRTWNQRFSRSSYRKHRMDFSSNQAEAIQEHNPL